MTGFFRFNRNFYLGGAVTLALLTILVFMNPTHNAPPTPMPDSHVTWEKALKAGTKAPDFTLRNHNGEPFTLSLALEKGPVVLTFFRGNWCPICAAQLKQIELERPAFEALGAQVVAISAQLPEQTAETQGKFGISFPVLSDTGFAVTKLYGVDWAMPEKTRQFTEDFIAQNNGGQTLVDFDGGDGLILPVPATYVIAQDGTIVYAYANENYKERAANKTLLQALRALQN